MATTTFRSTGKKRALLVAVRSAQKSDLPYLAFAHRDASALRDHLISSYKYQPEDIILMIDDKNHPRELWPTQRNVLRQIDQLTHDVPEDCHIFFYFSGHGLEETCSEADRASMRANGKDDEILCGDGKPILDHILHDRLISPLERIKGSKLFTLFDCCHSETLLDLQMGQGPNHYSKVWNMGRGQAFQGILTTVVALLQLFKRYRHNDASQTRRKSTNRSVHSQPVSVIRDVNELSVICLSACRDGQLAYDDPVSKSTFTSCFIDAMAQKPNITWIELRDTLLELIWRIRTRYEETYPEEAKCWTQEPRILTNSRTDLTQPVTTTLMEIDLEMC